MSKTDTGVSLRIPAQHRFIAPARVLAASLAADLDMTVDQIEELRIGVDEALALLIDATNRTGSLTIDFDVDDEGLTIEAVASQPAHDLGPDDLSQHILAAVVDEHQIGDDAIRLRKLRTST